MTSRTSFAPGKIILSGEYAVLFGYQGIAVPSSLGVQAVFAEDTTQGRVNVQWKDGERWKPYAEKIAEACRKKRTELSGALSVHADLPLGKGMGSSTALVIAVTRTLLGEESRTEAAEIENTLNPGHSGFDFAAIWEGAPVLFSTSAGARRIDLPPALLHNAILVDTGFPAESTAELVAWMRGREAEIQDFLSVIGSCTERLIQGEPLDIVMREHHRAQVALGVVPAGVQQLIAAVEQTGGAAKVIGAGSRTAGAGIVLAVGDREEIVKIASQRGMPIMTL